MKKQYIFLSSVLLGAVISFSFMTLSKGSGALGIGKKAPMATAQMNDVSGKSYSLNDLNGDNGLLVIFSCNTCPFVVGTGSKEGWEGRYNGLYDLASSNGLGMVLVNSNEAKRPNEDSMDEMKKRAKAKGYKMAYVIDENHKFADAVGARTTPHVYLFDKDLKLVYRGLIDDNVNSSSEVKIKYLENAMASMAKGELPDPATTQSMGCSIKRIN